MKTAAVVIDDWKLQTFKNHLDRAGLAYTEHPGVSRDTLTIRVNFESLEKIQPVIEAANAECARCKNNQKLH